jgi:signal-transduction protein with cAMP-binding, CBS, and nucleotidyltransferase domain
VTVAQQIQEVMTKQLHTVRKDATLRQVARLMQDQKIGNVIVTNPDGTLCGVVTDRDLVVRGMAAQRDVDKTKVGDVCTDAIVKLPPTASIDEAVKLMRERAVRRIPVVTDGKAIGIITIGDLARAKDPNSALAQISSAPPNN